MKISPYAIENIAPYIVGAKTGREIIKFFYISVLKQRSLFIQEIKRRFSEGAKGRIN